MTGRMPEQLSEWPVSGLREIFETTIVPRFLTPSRSFKSARERPMVVFVAGQPASQKSRLQQAIVEMVGLEDPVIIDADDFRACHPRYWRWARSYDRTAAARTHDAAAWWVDLAIDFASSHRYDTLVSATFKDPQSAMRKIEPFRQLFDISVVFCAVHEISSGVSVVARYLDQRNRRGFGRYVPLRVHDAACVGVLETAASIEADRSLDLNVYVYRPGLAGGGPQYANRRVGGQWIQGPPQVRSAIELERLGYWNAGIERFRETARSLLNGLGLAGQLRNGVASTVARLVTDAQVCLSIPVDHGLLNQNSSFR